MSYESPIKLYATQVEHQIEGEILRVIQKMEVVADKEELLRALQYDRNQYFKGYRDAISDHTLVKVVRCKDCKHSKLDNLIRCKTVDGETDDDTLYQCFYRWNYSEWNKGDHFCSYGERRTNEQGQP